ncbi:MAG: hypothetical protein ABTD50_13720 [Polyangiaceae bacterium]
MSPKEVPLVLSLLAAMPACWGAEFLTDPVSALDAGPGRDAATELNCANILNCATTGPLCCLSLPPQQPSCTNGSCGCFTALSCANDDNCSPGLVCCLKTAIDADCPGGHFVSACETACTSAEEQLCDPTSSSCPSGMSCSTSAATLGLYGITTGVGYGVCSQ